jgi:tRNA(Ile)-lysidine synthase
MPREVRDRLPVLEAGGRIVWVPGLARSREAVPGDRTTSVVRARCERIPPA